MQAGGTLDGQIVDQGLIEMAQLYKPVKPEKLPQLHKESVSPTIGQNYERYNKFEAAAALKK